MRQVVYMVWQLLSRRERGQAAAVAMLVLITALIDAVGVASVMPFLTLLADPQAIEDHNLLRTAYAISGHTNRQEFLFALGWVVLAVVILASVLQGLAQYTVVRFAEMRRVSLSARLMHSYLSQTFGFFFSRHSSDLAKNLLSEVDSVVGRCIMPLLLLLAHGLHALVLIGLVLWLEPLIASLAILVVAAAFSAIFFAMRRRISRLGTLRMEANKDRYMVTAETFGGIRDVKLRGLEKGFIAHFHEYTLRFSRYNAANEAAGIFPRYAVQVLVFSGMMLMLIILLAQQRDLDSILPTMGLLAFAGLRILPKFQIIYQALARIRFSVPSLTLLQEHLAMEAPEPPEQGDVQPMAPQKAIRLEQASFAYPHAQSPVVNALNLTLPVNGTVGIVGASGAGKTTLINLLLGLYAPQEGRLLIDDTPVTAANRRAWQKTLGYVPQDVFLLDGSLRQNIAFGMPAEAIDEAALQEALRRANLQAFVAGLPDGDATRVGERGLRLSGGQKQRVAIARALYHRPKVLIFDEATSAVDSVTEREIVEALKGLDGEQTIVMVAHRLDTLRHCDTIHVMEAGRIVASGDFDTLAREDSRFQAFLSGEKPAD